MVKPKYRYNNDTKEWELVFKCSTSVRVISGWQKPDGTLHHFDVRSDSALYNYYSKAKNLLNRI